MAILESEVLKNEMKDVLYSSIHQASDRIILNYNSTISKIATESHMIVINDYEFWRSFLNIDINTSTEGFLFELARILQPFHDTFMDYLVENNIALSVDEVRNLDSVNSGLINNSDFKDIFNDQFLSLFESYSRNESLIHNLGTIMRIYKLLLNQNDSSDVLTITSAPIMMYVYRLGRYS